MKEYHRRLIIDAIFLIAGLLIVLWTTESFAAEPTKYQAEKRAAKIAERDARRKIRRQLEVKYEACLHQCRGTCK